MIMPQGLYPSGAAVKTNELNKWKGTTTTGLMDSQAVCFPVTSRSLSF